MNATNRRAAGSVWSYFSAAVAAVSIALALPHSALADTLDALKAVPLSQSETLKGVKPGKVKPGTLKVPTITWGGDVATIDGSMDGGAFKKEGLDVELFNENDFARQVKGVCEGETPLLRGTIGMVNAAGEAMTKCGTELVVLYQMTWSNGGDALVVRSGINSLKDLKGKTIALQLYGPHMDFLTTILARAGLSLSDVKIVWLKELSLPTYDTKGKIVDPRSAFQADKSIDAAFVISPDAVALTSGGAEGVQGARVLFDSKAANRIIADVYAVRKDWFDANKAIAQKFTHALMLAQEDFLNLVSDKGNNQGRYTQLTARAADLLFGSPQAVADVEGLIGDAEFVGFAGNVAFFTGSGTTRNLEVMTGEIQQGFIQLGLMKKKTDVNSAGWDYTKLAEGLKNADLAAVPKPRFDSGKAAQVVEQKIASELETWEGETLIPIEILFAPNQTVFSAKDYLEAFNQVFEISQTMGGALIVCEGHNAPDAINKARREGQPQQIINTLEQQAKNISFGRAKAVCDAVIEYAKHKSVAVDESQFLAVGMGVKSPKFPVPATEKQWNENRRVVFRVKAIASELDHFEPAGK